MEKCRGFTFMHIKSISKNNYHALLYYKNRRTYTNLSNFNLVISGKTYTPKLKGCTKNDAKNFIQLNIPSQAII